MFVVYVAISEGWNVSGFLLGRPDFSCLLRIILSTEKEHVFLHCSGESEGHSPTSQTDSCEPGTQTECSELYTYIKQEHSLCMCVSE